MAFQIQWNGRSIRRYFVDEFFAKAIPQKPPTLKVLDLGGHKSAPRGDFKLSNYQQDVTVANLDLAKGADVQTDAAQVALKSETFDVIICGELLEHVEDPRLVLIEAFRLLKPGGRFCATVPFLFHIHADPHDYGRYTDHFWEENLSTTGFNQIEIERQGLYFSVMAGNREWRLKKIRPPRPFGRPTHWVLMRLVANPLKRIAIWRESFPAVQNNHSLNRFTTEFGIIAHKPSQQINQAD